jgi:DNA adenine methylase
MTEKDHQDLHVLLTKIQGRWILTYNDHPKIRELYRGCRIQEIVSEVGVKAPGQRAEYWRQLVIARK